MKQDMGETDVHGPWLRMKILGKGGFGIVTLWVNTVTKQEIAVKKLRELELEGIIKNKQKERWCKEVAIMSKLDHKNIVKAVDVPTELQVLRDHLPLLGMEYCSNGDLRQMLNKPENCCGLDEELVKNILTDIAHGLEYLHSIKIIHRDLKPDNIVLKVTSEGIVYKLIDLGYAKELDKNSICESFVGTIQYLAPELFLGKQYTCSVDYWSFGILAYEIITGYRPFLPGYTPANWMKQVKNKKNDVIAVIEEQSCEIVHYTHVARVHQLNKYVVNKLEVWLRSALDWNGGTRGKDANTKQVTLFTQLHDVFNNSKIIKIFSVPTYEILNYKIDDNVTVYQLQCWLQQDTNLALEDHILLTKDAKCMNCKSTVLACFQGNLPSSNDTSLYLFNCGVVNVQRKLYNKPAHVMELLDEPKRLLNYKNLKRSCTESIYFLQSERRHFAALCQGVKTKIEYIHQRCHAVRSLYEDACSEWAQVESLVQMMMVLHKVDLENYIELRKKGELPSSGFVQKWIDAVTDVESKMTGVRNTSNKTNNTQELEKAESLIQNLKFVQLAVHEVSFNQLVAEGCQVYQKVQSTPKDERSVSRNNADMVKVIYKCLENEDKCLNCEELRSMFRLITQAENHLARLVSPLTIWLKSCKIMKQVIENVQTQRQKDLWSLIRTKIQTVKETNNLEKSAKEAKDQDKLKPEETGLKLPKSEPKQDDKELKKVNLPSVTIRDLIANHAKGKDVEEQPGKVVEVKSTNLTEESVKVEAKPDNKQQFSPFHIPKTVHSKVESYKEDLVKPDFRISEPVSMSSINNNDNNSLLHQHYSDYDVDTMIFDNNALRHRTQNLTAKCHQMVQDVQSLNWDFLND